MSFVWGKSATESHRYLNAVARITGLPRAAKILIAIALDASVISLATVASIVLIKRALLPLGPNSQIALLGGLLTVIPSLYICRCYDAVVRFVSAYTLIRILRGVALGYLVLAVLLAFDGRLSNLWNLLPVAAIIISFLLASWRLAAAALLRPFSRYGDARRVLIYGAGEAGTQLASALMKNRYYRPVGFIDDRQDLRGRLVQGLKTFLPSELPQLKQAGAFERVLLAMPSARRDRRREILESLERLSITVMVMPGLDELAGGQRLVDELREVQIEDLLGRDCVEPIQPLMDLYLRDKSVMVTGAGGSIGAELCLQAIRCGARKLVLFESCEFALYKIEQDLAPIARQHRCELVPVLGNVCRQKHVAHTLLQHRVQSIYHAAAYKHVPLVEQNVAIAVHNNVFGTLSAARAALTAGVENFVLISSDKAVRPTSVMGKSKRACELIVQALAAEKPAMRMSMVRFGNVLASSGSVVPLFREQIRRGGPVTVTHPEVTRYFMTISEAAQLVIQASAMGGSGEVFVLDMGEPVKISQLAERMIRLSGLTPRDPESPDGDIAIEFTGLRPGEKLYEELLIGNDPKRTQHVRIFLAHEQFFSWQAMNEWLIPLQLAIDQDDHLDIARLLTDFVSPSLNIIIKPGAAAQSGAAM